MLLGISVLLGLLAGLARGGRLEHLVAVRLRGWYLVFAALAIQFVIFLPQAESLPATTSLRPVLHLGSFVLLFIVLALNWSQLGWGLRLIALGALANALAIVANGGYMPVDPSAMAFVRGVDAAAAMAGDYSNTAYLANPSLVWLTDWIPVPLPSPLAGNVISIGDLLIAAGGFVLVEKGLLGRLVNIDTLVKPR